MTPLEKEDLKNRIETEVVDGLKGYVGLPMIPTTIQSLNERLKWVLKHLFQATGEGVLNEVHWAINVDPTTQKVSVQLIPDTWEAREFLDGD
jgi:hypothetical protein